MPEPRLRLLDRRRWPLLERRFSEASCTALPRRLRKGLPLKQGSGMPTPLRPSGFRMSRQTLPTDVIPRLARPTLMVTYQREMATLCLGSLGIHRKHYLCDGMAARPSTPPAARARGHRLADSRPRHNYRVLHSEFSAAQQCPITRGFGAAKLKLDSSLRCSDMGYESFQYLTGSWGGVFADLWCHATGNSHR
jgi:hypothetical protein